MNLPPYKPGCDADPAKVACDYPPYKLNKLISTKFDESGSPAVGLVKNFTISNDDQNLVSTDIAEKGMSTRTTRPRSGSTRTRTRSRPGSQQVAPPISPVVPG